MLYNIYKTNRLSFSTKIFIYSKENSCQSFIKSATLTQKEEEEKMTNFFANTLNPAETYTHGHLFDHIQGGI